MTDTPFLRLAGLARDLESTTKRGEMADRIAEFLAALSPAEVPAAVRLAIGQVFPEWDGRALNVSWKAVTTLVDEMVDASPADRAEAGRKAIDGGEFFYRLLQAARRQPPVPPALTLLDVYRTFEEIAATAGSGSRARKERLLRSLLARASDDEARSLVKIIAGDMRHGASEGVMLDGIARAAGVKAGLVRRANQLWGDLGEVALVAVTEGVAGLQQAAVRLFRPLKPMLAQAAEGVDEAFAEYKGQVALEYKLDGARVQIHRRGDEVHIYSRQLSDVTDSLPDVAAEVRAGMSAQAAIVEGEVIAVDAAGRPLPFQHLMRRFRRKHGVGDMITAVPVCLYLFDALYRDGQSLVDAGYEARWQALIEIAGKLAPVPRLLPATVEEGQAFALAAHDAGHEGVMAKELSSPYNPGVRGKTWLKIKHVHTLDLAIIAAEWGYGRRHGWLSNYHLGARDEETGEFRMIGKTFKGLTDAQFEEMTGRLLELEQGRRGNVVYVQPKTVVEVLFNEVQESSQYPSGFALRFARIARIRDDKPVGETDTIHQVARIYEGQFRYKGQLEFQTSGEFADRIAQEKESEEQWDELLARPDSQKLLREMAQVAREDYAAGRTTGIIETDEGELGPE
ncbi:MAG: ATP-dependent DNA ligase [Anaerolineae bacterium]|nr:ATP-dependent DNA ligase [Anaerolineae bacterium]